MTTQPITMTLDNPRPRGVQAMSAPEVIYLQYGTIPAETSWCDTKIHETDIEYIRKDKYDDLVISNHAYSVQNKAQLATILDIEKERDELATALANMTADRDMQHFTCNSLEKLFVNADSQNQELIKDNIELAAIVDEALRRNAIWREKFPNDMEPLGDDLVDLAKAARGVK